jgi:hypothetical protein
VERVTGIEPALSAGKSLCDVFSFAAGELAASDNCSWPLPNRVVARVVRFVRLICRQDVPACRALVSEAAARACTPAMSQIRAMWLSRHAAEWVRQC